MKLLTLTVFAVSADQFSKYVAWQLHAKTGDLSLLSGLVEFTFVFNSGGFLSVLSSLPEGLRFFLLNICVGLLLLGCLYYLFVYESENKRYIWPLAWITAGGLSNLLDRVIHERGVMDFVSIGIGSFRTGIFNLADVYILIGSFILGYFLFTTNFHEQ